MQNIKNRSIITNSRILLLIKECLDNTQAMGFKCPPNIRFLQCKAQRRAGLACHADSTIVLSSFIFKEKDEAIKSIIYHELGHIIAGPHAHHGPGWYKVVNKMSAVTGIKITRCYSEEDLPIHAEEKKKAWKFNFRCKGCGCMLHYYRRTDFVNTYNQILPSGNPRWTCTKCGGTFEKIDK